MGRRRSCVMTTSWRRKVVPEESKPSRERHNSAFSCHRTQRSVDLDPKKHVPLNRIPNDLETPPTRQNTTLSSARHQRTLWILFIIISLIGLMTAGHSFQLVSRCFTLHFHHMDSLPCLTGTYYYSTCSPPPPPPPSYSGL